MNRAAIRTLARIFLNEATEGFFLDTELNTCINVGNQAVNDIITSLKEDFFLTTKTFSTTAGSKSYTWPSGMGGIRRLEHYNTADAGDIQKIDILEFPRLEAQGDYPFNQNGKPRRYIPFGDHYDLLPVPDAVYTLRIYYDAVAEDLSSDTVSPSSPAKFHDMIAIYAAILMRTKNQEDSTDLKQLWEDREDKLITYIKGLEGSEPKFAESYMEGLY